VTKADYCAQRFRYHQGWCVRYSVAGLACFVASFFAIPDRRGFLALCVGYCLYALAARERRRARQVLQ
jgi:hypothetical protein